MDFTQEEWEKCIKVLKILAKDPDKGLDINVLKGLVTKIHKQAKKQNKAKVQAEILASVEIPQAFLSLQKAQKVITHQDIYKQYDIFLKSNTLLFQNYEGILQEKEAEREEKEFIYPQKCYQCRQPYKQLHFFYHSMCVDCGTFNYEKRSQKANLQGRIALITGARVKIGYLTALRMLRDGAKVWATTRFVKDCAKRFSQESDFDTWAHRLKIVDLDLRNLKAVQDFVQYLLQNETHLDIIINNAAQTVKRPQAFYQHLFEFEQQEKALLPEKWQQILPFDTPFHFLTSVAEQKLLPYQTDSFFPKGEYDKHQQQIDKRTQNSWTLLLDQVPAMEMLETQLVNVTAPFMLNSMLKPLLCQSPFDRKFIINVSAMEGQFNRAAKTPFHPHTNMAKAALNMMTRTSAQDYALSGIFMNSVDTGWITQENPFHTQERLYQEEGFVPPLDEIDGMARIYDPIASGLYSTEMPLFGHFLKDYKPYFW